MGLTGGPADGRDGTDQLPDATTTDIAFDDPFVGHHARRCARAFDAANGARDQSHAASTRRIDDRLGQRTRRDVAMRGHEQRGRDSTGERQAPLVLRIRVVEQRVLNTVPLEGAAHHLPAPLLPDRPAPPAACRSACIRSFDRSRARRDG